MTSRRESNIPERRSSVHFRRESLYRDLASEHQAKKQQRRKEKTQNRQQPQRLDPPPQPSDSPPKPTPQASEKSIPDVAAKKHSLHEQRFEFASHVPFAALRLLKILRRVRVRQRLCATSSTPKKPTLDMVKVDKMLALFPDEHLIYLINHLQLEYFYDREMIIAQALEEDRAYFLESGNADVLVGVRRVFTMNSGMCFGSIGMIASEARTASVMASGNLVVSGEEYFLGGCYVWFIAREMFEAFDARNHHVSAAQAMIREQRRRNMRESYKNVLASQAFKDSYEILSDVPIEAIDAAMDEGEPYVLRPNHPIMMNTTETVCLLLRGAVRLTLDSDPEFYKGNTSAPSYLIDPTTSLDELLAHYVQLPRARTRTGGTKSMQQYVKHIPTSSNGDLVMDISAPCLLNLPYVIVGLKPPFRCDARSSCDALMLEGRRVKTLLGSAKLMKRCLQIHEQFMRRVDDADLRHLIFRGPFMFNFSHDVPLLEDESDPSHSLTLHLRPAVLVKGTTISFHGHDDLDLEGLIVVEGLLAGGDDGELSSKPGELALWPVFPRLLLGSENIETVVMTSVVAGYFFPRRELLRLLCQYEVNELEVLASAVATWTGNKLGLKPTMNVSGLHPTKRREGRLISTFRKACDLVKPAQVVRQQSIDVKSAGESSNPLENSPTFPSMASFLNPTITPSSSTHFLDELDTSSSRSRSSSLSEASGILRRVHATTVHQGEIVRESTEVPERESRELKASPPSSRSASAFARSARVLH